MNRFSGWWPNFWAFLAGLGLGLMFCGTGYAGVVDRLVVDGQKLIVDDLPTIRTYDGLTTARQEDVCYIKMESAMRAREEWAKLTDEDRQWVNVSKADISIDAPIVQYATSFGDEGFYGDRMPMYTPAPPDRRTREQMREDEQKALDARKVQLAKDRVEQAAEKERERVKQERLSHLKAVWDEAKKDCWRQP